MPKKTLHYTAGSFNACGMAGHTTPIAPNVTCKACRRSVTFRTHHPEFAIAPTEGGRPKAQGVQRIIKFWVSEDLNQWLNAQETVADTIVRALTELQRRSKR